MTSQSNKHPQKKIFLLMSVELRHNLIFLKKLKWIKYIRENFHELFWRICWRSKDKCIITTNWKKVNMKKETTPRWRFNDSVPPLISMMVSCKIRHLGAQISSHGQQSCNHLGCAALGVETSLLSKKVAIPNYGFCVKVSMGCLKSSSPTHGSNVTTTLAAGVCVQKKHASTYRST